MAASQTTHYCLTHRCRGDVHGSGSYLVPPPNPRLLLRLCWFWLRLLLGGLRFPVVWLRLWLIGKMLIELPEYPVFTEDSTCFGYLPLNDFLYILCHYSASFCSSLRIRT